MSKHSEENAIGALRVAFSLLPASGEQSGAERAMRALLMADTEGLAEWLQVRMDEAFQAGYVAGCIATEAVERERFDEREHALSEEFLRSARSIVPREQVRRERCKEDVRDDYMGGPADVW